MLVGQPHFPLGADGAPQTGWPPGPSGWAGRQAAHPLGPGSSRILICGGGKGRWNGWHSGVFHGKLHAPADAGLRQELAPCASACRTSLTELAGLCESSACSLAGQSVARDVIPASEHRQATICVARRRLAGAPEGGEVRIGRDPGPPWISLVSSGCSTGNCRRTGTQNPPAVSQRDLPNKR